MSGAAGLRAFAVAPSRWSALLLAAMLSGCTILPKALDAEQRERLAAETMKALYEGQAPIERPVTLAESVARAIKYHAELRQRQMEEAAALAQLEVGRFDLLPRLTANAGYTTRNNDAFGFGFTPGGTVATNPSASTERTRTTASLGFSWNILDFGVSYYRARQLADQSLIAEERRRKAVQTLVHDVRVAWWRAEAAQRLLPRADALLEEVDRAIEKTRVIEARALLPPLQTATLRRALLDLAQQISFRRQELAQAAVELASLVNAPPGSRLRVAAPATDEREVHDLTADVEKLEALALRARPELQEEGYRERITRDEARKALAALLPGISLDAGRNYDSNRFLVNNLWNSAGLNVVFNLVKVFSLPALERSAEAQKRVDAARRLAMATAILAQTRLASVRYGLVAEEFLVWDEAARDDDLIVKYLSASAKVGIDTELELIRARARAMASHMNRDLAYANVQASMARLYNSIGYDAVPRSDEGRPLAELAELVGARFGELHRASFSPRPPPERPTVAVGDVTGLDGDPARQLRDGIRRVLELSKVPLVEPDNADLRLHFAVVVQPSTEGRRPATVNVLVQSRGADKPRAGASFQTTLSDPVEAAQWEVLGEGALYRILENLRPLPERRPSLRLASQMTLPGDAPARTAVAQPEVGQDALALRVDRSLAGALNANPTGHRAPHATETR